MLYISLKQSAFCFTQIAQKFHRAYIAIARMCLRNGNKQPDGKRECNDAFFVRFVRSV